MAPKKQANKKVKGPQNAPLETKEAYERELKQLAKQAKNEVSSKWFMEQARAYLGAAALLTIGAISTVASKVNLSPIYGAIPADVHHQKVVLAACFVGWSANLAIRRTLPFKTIMLLPLVAVYIPVVQFYLFQHSQGLTAHYGPLVTESLTVFPLIVLVVACAADILERADLSSLPRWLADSAPGIVSYGIFKFNEILAERQLLDQSGSSLLQTRVGIEMALAGTYAIMAPSRWLLLGFPALLHAAFLNTHLVTPMSTQSLNSQLNAQGWSVVDRWESVTGYISVLDSHENGFRVMRCDHSLLGGEWTRLSKEIVAEPIYAVFTMLEAVRLVEVEKKVPDDQARALNIGLGIGTTPSALIAHGIDTTIVEIDPLVYEYAVKYFALPSNHTAVIEDAVSYTARLAKERIQTFDYIIHDVFTGGAEPIPLFTLEFLENLHSLLSPNGVIAINYAGDFLLPPLSTVVQTVRQVFPSCRIFRESPPPAKPQVEEQGQDFDNMIIFCRKTADRVNFRQPVEVDYLKSRSRKQFLLPQHEVPEAAFLTGPKVGVVRENSTASLATWHSQTALGHWAVMRNVIPASIWEAW